MEKLIDISAEPVASVLEILLQDKTTGRNIIWATDTYADLGEGFAEGDEIRPELLLRHPDIIKPRIQKSQDTQAARTRSKAEVFTPAWLCNLMNNYSDEDWFGRKAVFNVDRPDRTWTPVEGAVEMPEDKTWRQYVDSRRLEITCGEAPYLVSRYDVSTGDPVNPLQKRIGQLDRKLRIVNENAADSEEWAEWAVRAFEATYGYEYQGDNLLIARINLLMTFADYFKERFGVDPSPKSIRKVADIISWNLWQMDGMQDSVPLPRHYDESDIVTLFDESSAGEPLLDDTPEAPKSKIYDWRTRKSFTFSSIKRR